MTNVMLKDKGLIEAKDQEREAREVRFLDKISPLD